MPVCSLSLGALFVGGAVHGVAVRRAVLASCVLWASFSPSAAQAQNWEANYENLMKQWAEAAQDDKTNLEKTLEECDKAYVELRTTLFKIKLSEKADERAKLEVERKTQEAKALALYQGALAKALNDKTVEADKLDELRERVSYLTFQNQRFEHAAWVGEYLARKNPENEYALRGAQIATAAYAQLYNQASAAKKTDDMNRRLDSMVSITGFVAKTWKDRPEGQEALGRLAKYALAAGDPKQAENILKQLPADSPEHHELNLRMAQGAWYKYVTWPNQPEAQRPAEAERKKWKAQAKDALSKSTEWLRKKLAGQPSTTLLSAELSLTQIYLDDGDFKNAQKVLEIPNTGLLEQARLNLAALNQNGTSLRPEVYRLAMQTYMGLKDFEKAEVAVLGMSSGSKPEDVTKLFTHMAKLLYDEVEADRKNGAGVTQLQGKLASLGAMLERVAQRKEGHTFGSLAWPAETMFNLAKSLDAGGSAPPPEVKDYYQKASNVYQEILRRAAAEPNFGDPNSILALRVNLAACQSRLGNPLAARVQLVEILAENPRQIAAQIQTAYIYQEIAQQTSKPEVYDLAMMGGEPRKPKSGKGPEENVVWGWGKIAQMTANNTTYRNEYHEARYNQAYCRLRQAMMRSDPAQRKTGALAAENDIRVTFTLSRDMGGPEWQSRFDQLLRAVQQELGKPVTGLPDKKSAAAPAKS